MIQNVIDYLSLYSIQDDYEVLFCGEKGRNGEQAFES